MNEDRNVGLVIGFIRVFQFKNLVNFMDTYTNKELIIEKIMKSNPEKL